MKIRKLWVCIIFISNSVFAQVSIKGFVKDSTQLPIVSANVLLKDSTNSKIISYSITDSKGFYKIENIKYKEVAFLSVGSLGYKKESIQVNLAKEGKEIVKNFNLKKEVTLLQEVQVKAKILPIQQRKDTVSYNVDKFTDGTEEVIEDVIKKLPGLDVSENGKISYKGKPIDKVLIEGDDMFDKNYTIATKNISSEVIDKVQAIENYQENKHLKGIKDSDKQVLNILLKEDVKAKPYGSGNFAYGYKERYDVSVNLIGVNKKNKYYILGSANNIGINPSPYDYFSLASLNEDEKSATELINIDYLIPNITTRRININESIFGATNLIFKPSEKFKIKSNIFFTKDKNILNRENQSTFITSTKNIRITENQELVRKPLIGESKLGIDYDISDNSEINYSLEAKLGKIDDNGTQSASSGVFKENLLSEYFFINQNLKYTNRLSDKSALLLTSSYLYNDKPQEYSLTPSIQNNIIQNIPDNFEDYLTLQKSKMELNEFKFQSEFLKTYKRGNYNISLSYFDVNEKLNSQLLYQNLDDNSNINTGIENFVNNRQRHLSIEVKNKRTFTNWDLVYGISGNFKSAVLDNFKESVYYLSPKLGLKVKLGLNSKFTSIYNYNKNYPNLSDLYGNYILTNYRTFSKGNTFLNIIGSHAFLANYNYSDWFNQFNFFVNFIHIDNDKAYNSRIFIDDSITFSEKILVSGNKNYISTMQISKFIPFISSTIKLNTNLSWYNYFNVVNDSELRNNLSFSSNYKLSLKSAFNELFDFEINANLLSSIFTTSNNVKTENKNIELFANFIFRPNKKWLIKISNERLSYNIEEQNNLNYYFLDTDIKYTSKKNKLSFKLKGRNLLNEVGFERLSISDYFFSTQRFDLLPRHILLEVNYRF